MTTAANDNNADDDLDDVLEELALLAEEFSSGVCE
jgi:hypothetical protein